MPTDGLLQTDTLDDATSSLELALRFYEQAGRDDRYWKWFVVALHSGIQGVFVLALEQSNGIRVQKPGVGKMMLAAFLGAGEYPMPHMDNFLNLHKKLIQSSILPVKEIGSLPGLKEQESALDGLDRLRDEFLHFNAKGWDLEIALIEEHARIGARVASYIVLESDAILDHNHGNTRRLCLAISTLATRLKIERL